MSRVHTIKSDPVSNSAKNAGTDHRVIERPNITGGKIVQIRPDMAEVSKFTNFNVYLSKYSNITFK